MTIEIRIPKIGVSMTEASLARWYVADGARVAAGEPLYVLEMDKTTNDIESPAAGTVRIIGEIGVAYPVGELIATISP